MTVTDAEALQDTEVQAAQVHARACLVHIAQEPPRPLEVEIGSGTLLVTPRGHLVVLTARHVVEGFTPGAGRPWLVGVTPESGPPRLVDSIPNAIAAVVQGPADRDVALVVLAPEHSATFSPRAIRTDAIASPSDPDPEFVVAAGCPTRLALVKRDGDVLTVGTITMSYATFIKGRDARGRYIVDWSEAVFGDEVRSVPHTGVAPGRQATPKPHGVSGGALWRFAPAFATEVWSAERCGRIVGVLESWCPEDRVEYAEPVSAWGDWFQETVARIDGS